MIIWNNLLAFQKKFPIEFRKKSGFENPPKLKFRLGLK